MKECVPGIFHKLDRIFDHRASLVGVLTDYFYLFPMDPNLSLPLLMYT